MTIYELRSVQGTWISGIGTILVTCALVIVTIIMYRKQMDLMKQNLKVQLYRQRYDIYKRLERILKDLAYGNNPKKNFAFEELTDISEEVYLLFNKDINNYFEIIEPKAENLSLYINKEEDDDYNELVSWFKEQLENKIIIGKFKLYLDLSNYGLDIESSSLL